MKPSHKRALEKLRRSPAALPPEYQWAADELVALRMENASLRGELKRRDQAARMTARRLGLREVERGSQA